MFEFYDHNDELVTVSALHFVAITQFSARDVLVHVTNGGPHRTAEPRAVLKARISECFER